MMMPGKHNECLELAECKKVDPKKVHPSDTCVDIFSLMSIGGRAEIDKVPNAITEIEGKTTINGIVGY
jgi:hypothetical protein